jgi:membrane fusion protein, multidrug efflux system
VKIAFGDATVFVGIPESAVLHSPSGSYLFVVERDPEGIDRCFQRTIRVTDRSEGFVFVAEGLRFGERVVSEGSFKLRPGLMVRHIESSNSPQADGGRVKMISSDGSSDNENSDQP